MLKYFKGDGKSTWLLRDENECPKDATFETVLSLEFNPDDIESSLDQTYWGPFYFDIDNEDIEKAFDDTRKLVKYIVKAYSLNPETDMQIFSTGKKGFHILLNPYLFLEKKGYKLLPYRYKLMATSIKNATNTTIDMAVYSGKKGRMWRIANKQRDDNKRYKVMISYTDVISESVDYVINKSAAPGKEATTWIKVKKNSLLQSLFKTCEIPVQTAKAPIETKKLKEMPTPKGIIKLANLEDIKPDARFNGLVLNAAVYGARMGWTEANCVKYFEKILSYQSTVYKTHESKLEHFLNIFKFVSDNEDYKFDCHFLSTVVDVNCAEMQIKAEEIEDDDFDDEFGIYAKSSSYYLATEDGSRRLTGFTIKILHDIRDQNGEVSYELLLKNARGRTRKIIVPENCFASKASFARYLSPDFPLFCSEKELVMISWHIRREEPTLQIGRDYIGLHYIDKKWHYANAEGSMSLDQDIDRVKVNAKSLTIVNTSLDKEWPALDAKAMEQAIRAMFSFNVPQVAVPLSLWFLSAFFKPHYQETFSQFPLLFVFGEAGAGKTTSVLKLRRLFAMDDVSLKSISDVTQFSLMAACNSSNMIPLILDEYKPMMMKETQSQLVSRLIRGAYNSSRGERGTAQQEIVAYYYRAPIVLLGEQSIIETAVQHRVIEVQLTRQYINKIPKELFDALDDIKLESIGKMFLTFAMAINPDEVKTSYTKAMTSLIEDGLALPERPLFNNGVLKNTLHYLIEFLSQFGIDLDKFLFDKFEEYIKYLKSGNTIIDSLINKNDVVKIIEVFNQMADFTTAQVNIIPNSHYAYKDGFIHLDIESIYPLFAKYNKDYNLGLFDPGYVSFMKMLQKESFCATLGRATTIGDRVKVIATLDYNKMKQLDIACTNLVPKENQ